MTVQSFANSLIGSMPRSKTLLKAQRDLSKNRLEQDEYEDLVYQETKKIVRLQEKYDLDYIVSGELARDNYVSFIANSLNNVKMMSNTEMLDYIEDKQAYEDMLGILDVPGSVIKNAICFGKISRDKSLVGSELKMLKEMTDHKVKITLPGPYLVTRSMWLKGLSDNFYDSKEELGEDVVQCLTDEVKDLQKLGVDTVQFDEPVLTEVVFSPEHTRTFMCASLSEKKDPTDELAFAKDLLKKTFDGIDRSQSNVALHVCRGNWSKDESILLEGPYTPLLDLFDYANPDILYLEYSTDRAGSIDSLFTNHQFGEKTILGLGVMNPRKDETESKETIIKQVDQALDYLPANRINLNPDCGFATFSKKPVNSLAFIENKLQVLSEVKQELRDRYDQS